MRIHSLSVLLIFALSLFTLSILVRAGSPQPPPPHGAISQPSTCQGFPIDGALIVKTSDHLMSRTEFARAVARNFFGQGNLDVLYSIECVDIRRSPQDDTAVKELSYNTVPLDSIDENFLDKSGDFLVTDGALYFRIKLDSQ